MTPPFPRVRLYLRRGTRRRRNAKVSDGNRASTRRENSTRKHSPDSSPPSSVGLVVLELSREEKRDEELVEGSLDRHRGEDSEDGVGRVPSLEEPLRRRGRRW